MKKTNIYIRAISLAVVIAFSITTACYGYSLDALRPQATGSKISLGGVELGNKDEKSPIIEGVSAETLDLMVLLEKASIIVEKLVTISPRVLEQTAKNIAGLIKGNEELEKQLDLLIEYYESRQPEKKPEEGIIHPASLMLKFLKQVRDEVLEIKKEEEELWVADSERREFLRKALGAAAWSMLGRLRKVISFAESLEVEGHIPLSEFFPLYEQFTYGLTALRFIFTGEGMLVREDIGEAYVNLLAGGGFGFIDIKNMGFLFNTIRQYEDTISYSAVFYEPLEEKYKVREMLKEYMPALIARFRKIVKNRHNMPFLKYLQSLVLAKAEWYTEIMRENVEYVQKATPRLKGKKLIRSLEWFLRRMPRWINDVAPKGESARWAAGYIKQLAKLRDLTNVVKVRVGKKLGRTNEELRKMQRVEDGGDVRTEKEEELERKKREEKEREIRKEELEQTEEALTEVRPGLVATLQKLLVDFVFILLAKIAQEAQEDGIQKETQEQMQVVQSQMQFLEEQIQMIRNIEDLEDLGIELPIVGSSALLDVKQTLSDEHTPAELKPSEEEIQPAHGVMSGMIQGKRTRAITDATA